MYKNRLECWKKSMRKSRRYLHLCYIDIFWYCYDLCIWCSCYQTYPNTENKLTWSNKDNIVVSYSKNKTISLLNLDVSPEPGFSIIYFISKMMIQMSVIVIVLLYYIYYIIIYRNYKNKKSLNRKNKK